MLRTSITALSLLASACATGMPAGDDDAGPIDTCSARYAVARRRPEVTVVLDRSCAMQMRVDAPSEVASGPTDPSGRWGAARAALEALVSARAATGWGLALYPDDPLACDVAGLRVEPALGSGAELVTTLANDGVVDPFALCSAGTAEVPLEPALNALFASAQIGSTGLPLVLVIGAGTPACGSTTDTLAATARDLGFEVAVVALAPDATASSLLRSVAPEGSYYEALGAADVATAIEGAIESVSGCVFDLEGASSPEPTELRVWVDGEPILPDPDQGWSYSAGDDSIALNGALCDRLVAGELTRVDAALGCDEHRCVPRDEACDGLDDDCDGEIDEDCL